MEYAEKIEGAGTGDGVSLRSADRGLLRDCQATLITLLEMSSWDEQSGTRRIALSPATEAQVVERLARLKVRLDEPE